MNATELDAYLSQLDAEGVISVEPLPKHLRLSQDDLHALSLNVREEIALNAAMRNGSAKAAGMTSTK